MTAVLDRYSLFTMGNPIVSPSVMEILKVLEVLAVLKGLSCS